MTQTLFGVAGSLPISGTVTVAVIFPADPDHITVLVVPTLPGGIHAILGHPWMSHRRFLLDLDTNKLTICGVLDTTVQLSLLAPTATALMVAPVPTPTETSTGTNGMH